MTISIYIYIANIAIWKLRQSKVYWTSLFKEYELGFSEGTENLWTSFNAYITLLLILLSLMWAESLQHQPNVHYNFNCFEHKKGGCEKKFWFEAKNPNSLGKHLKYNEAV